ncbi:MAG TPA: hypothetical protein DDW78_04865 [Treponema sp.]|nr:hypothetical protein [Treponema sp.]
MHSPKNYIALFFSVLVLATASCSGRKFSLPERTLLISTADGRSVAVQAEIARKEEERNYGFMNRKHIPAGTGMLFVFESDQVLRFWMKDTPHPLSIAYIDADGVIRDILDMTPYSTASVKSSVSVRYALEVPQGWFAEEHIAPGDSVALDSGEGLRSLR